MPAELKICDSVFMLSEEQPNMGCRGPQSLGGTTVSLYLYVPDVDKAFNQAVTAGATVVMPVADMFWGDRMGKVADPFGHECREGRRLGVPGWAGENGRLPHNEDLTAEEIEQRGKAFFAQMAGATR